MKEGDLVRDILEAYAGHPRVMLWRANTGVARMRGFHVRFGKVGQGDITGITEGGRRVEIECKLKKNAQREAQVEFADMIRRMGGIYILAFSVEDVSEALQLVREQIRKENVKT